MITTDVSSKNDDKTYCDLPCLDTLPYEAICFMFLWICYKCYDLSRTNSSLCQIVEASIERGKTKQGVVLQRASVVLIVSCR